ncbi:biotin--[acetyl-CoA-carboxylase] ligase [Nitratireductor sp. XY-223]|uniref:biotin--[acetyl-CoA-carboxylase] ligase n=1 Tax=Nitratireductor sp. XY-223 TaxID=2561926 RepID=UPI0010AA026E|nr:biotin--[acetyl-CoA-carboxylase] ligase [Nitratireductor sp. XY-223]
MSSAGGEYRHEALGDLDSTNLECLERARQGDRGNLWITANRQLKGRGRRGRGWVSEPGNLYASLLLIDVAPQEALASLPLAVGVAVYKAISQVLPPGGNKASIKWPNDILVGGKKVAGILLESEALPDGTQAVVIGCGVDVAHAPDEVMYPVTTLHAAGSAVSPDELFARLFQAMQEELARWDRGRGIAAVREAWLDAAEGIGGPITINLPDSTLSGTFRNIDASGCLVLVDDDNNIQTVAAGDVFFGRP